jgi:hypothetical protein
MASSGRMHVVDGADDLVFGNLPAAGLVDAFVGTRAT